MHVPNITEGHFTIISQPPHYRGHIFLNSPSICGSFHHIYIPLNIPISDGSTLADLHHRYSEQEIVKRVLIQHHQDLMNDNTSMIKQSLDIVKNGQHILNMYTYYIQMQ